MARGWFFYLLLLFGWLSSWGARLRTGHKRRRRAQHRPRLLGPRDQPKHSNNNSGNTDTSSYYDDHGTSGRAELRHARGGPPAARGVLRTPHGGGPSWSGKILPSPSPTFITSRRTNHNLPRMPLSSLRRAQCAVLLALGVGVGLAYLLPLVMQDSQEKLRRVRGHFLCTAPAIPSGTTNLGRIKTTGLLDREPC